MSNLIAFTAYQRVGKSTAAEYLAEKYKFQRINMKDALIAEMKEKFPDLLREICIEEGLYFVWGGICTVLDSHIDELFKLKPPIMRALMQNYGTEVRRGDNPNYWTEKWKIAYAKLHPANVVVDDVRFMEEYEAVKSMGGIIVRLTRPDILSGGTHESETEQDQIEADYTIECEQGNLQKLYTALDEICNTK